MKDIESTPVQITLEVAALGQPNEDGAHTQFRVQQGWSAAGERSLTEQTFNVGGMADLDLIPDAALLGILVARYKGLQTKKPDQNTGVILHNLETAMDWLNKRYNCAAEKIIDFDFDDTFDESTYDYTFPELLSIAQYDDWAEAQDAIMGATIPEPLSQTDELWNRIGALDKALQHAWDILES